MTNLDKQLWIATMTMMSLKNEVWRYAQMDTPYDDVDDVIIAYENARDWVNELLDQQSKGGIVNEIVSLDN